MFLVGVASGAEVGRAASSRSGPRLLRKRSPGIIENASDASISTDESQHIVLANPSAAAMFATTGDRVRCARAYASKAYAYSVADGS